MEEEQFQEMKNAHMEQDPFVVCMDCGKKQHKVCMVHHDQIWPQGFCCDNCLKKKGAKLNENKISAKELPTSKLSTYIETRVNNFLMTTEDVAGEVHIRVVASSEKIVAVKPRMGTKFVESGELAAEFPYQSKALFAFQEVDGTDICFFRMHVQEYGSDCPSPNTRRVYIAYLDSVHFFQPRQYSTAVYHEILLGYLDYTKQLGYTMAHIWACRHFEGDDYIYSNHLPEQKISKPEMLQEWFKQMLDKGKTDGPVLDYKDVLIQAMEDDISSAAELPYFQGDFWPNILEEYIKELDQEEEERRKLSGAEDVMLFEEDEQGPDEKERCSKRAKISEAAPQKQGNPQQDSDLTAKMFATMVKHKEVFFVIRLHSAQSAASLPPIQDPDPLVKCDLIEGDQKISSTQRACFSMLCMMYDLQNKFLYMCNSCKSHVEMCYRCTVCDDFDMCVPCYDKEPHPHKMKKLGPAMKQAISQKAPKAALNTGIMALVHACQCLNNKCYLPLCQKMKRSIAHNIMCERRSTGDCHMCNELIWLCCAHVKHCQQSQCSVLLCNTIKKEKHLQMELVRCPVDKKQTNVQESREQALKTSVLMLEHVCHCTDDNCRMPKCPKMKLVLKHSIACDRKDNGECDICKQLVTICCVHAKECQEMECKVILCSIIKRKLTEQDARNQQQVGAGVGVGNNDAADVGNVNVGGAGLVPQQL